MSVCGRSWEKYEQETPQKGSQGVPNKEWEKGRNELTIEQFNETFPRFRTGKPSKLVCS